MFYDSQSVGEMLLALNKAFLYLNCQPRIFRKVSPSVTECVCTKNYTPVYKHSWMQKHTRVHVKTPQIGLGTATTARESHSFRRTPRPVLHTQGGTLRGVFFAHPGAEPAGGVVSTRNSRATGGGRRRKPPQRGGGWGSREPPSWASGARGQGAGVGGGRGRRGRQIEAPAPDRGAARRAVGEDPAAGGRSQIRRPRGRRGGRGGVKGVGAREGAGGGRERSGCGLPGLGRGLLPRVVTSRSRETCSRSSGRRLGTRGAGHCAGSGALGGTPQALGFLLHSSRSVGETNGEDAGSAGAARARELGARGPSLASRLVFSFSYYYCYF